MGHPLLGSLHCLLGPGFVYLFRPLASVSKDGHFIADYFQEPTRDNKEGIFTILAYQDFSRL